MSPKIPPIMLGLLLSACSCSGGSTGKDALTRTHQDRFAPETTVETTSPRETTSNDTVEVPETRAMQCAPLPPRTLASVADETFDLGPYLMSMTDTSVTIMWRTSKSTDGRVFYRQQGQEQEISVEGSSTAAVHEITLTELLPATLYEYRVEAGENSSQVHEFMTAPSSKDGFRFLVWGDNQNGPEVFSQLVSAMLPQGPHMLVGVGDHVQEGKKAEQFKTQLFGPGRVLFHQVPFFAAMGNHEQNAETWYQLFSYPAADVPVDPFSESYYSYTFGNTFFLVINTNTIIVPVGDTDTPISAWIRDQVNSPEAQAATWRVAYAHEPAISESWSAGDCKYDGYLQIREFVMPLLAESGFHLYMSGHTHAYERSMLDGVLHIITGGGGGGLDEWCKDFEQTTVVYQNHHFLRIDAGCEKLRIEGVNLAGEVFDWVELDASNHGQIVDEGPAPGLPELIISDDSPEK